MNNRLSSLLFYYPATLLRGENVLAHLPRYRHFQWRPQQDIEAYQRRQLGRLLDFAYRNTTYYRQLFDRQSIEPRDIHDLSDLAKLPFLTKHNLVMHAPALTANTRFASWKTTGGSTGQAVTVLKNPDALARERAATWRGYEWAGVGVGDRQGRLWGVPIQRKNRVASYVVDLIANRKRFSAFNLTEERLAEYYAELLRFRPVYLYGYVSMIAELATFIRKHDKPPLPGLKAVITTSEVLSPESRSLIENTFQCRVFNEYGCGEVGSIAHECEHGNLHVMSDNLIVELDMTGAWHDGVGEIVVTDLHNYAMPLIRYKVGDLGSLRSETCPCGRGLHSIEKVHGRAYDFIVDPKGAKHHPELILYIFEEIKQRDGGIAQFQAVQTAQDQLDITIVPAESYSKDTEGNIVTKIRTKLDPAMNVRFRYASRIDREPSGKLRVVKSLLAQSR